MSRVHATALGDIPFTPEEEAEWDAKEAAWVSNAINRRAEEIRIERNAKLALSDWRMLSDMPSSTSWAAYRQSLRDIPLQVGFPWEITWPQEP
jgi:hypothetical protein